MTVRAGRDVHDYGDVQTDDDGIADGDADDELDEPGVWGFDGAVGEWRGLCPGDESCVGISGGGVYGFAAVDGDADRRVCEHDYAELYDDDAGVDVYAGERFVCARSGR